MNLLCVVISSFWMTHYLIGVREKLGAKWCPFFILQRKLAIEEVIRCCILVPFSHNTFFYSSVVNLMLMVDACFSLSRTCSFYYVHYIFTIVELISVAATCQLLYCLLNSPSYWHPGLCFWNSDLNQHFVVWLSQFNSSIRFLARMNGLLFSSNNLLI